MEWIGGVGIITMEWQFRKALESFEGYKRRSSAFKNQIENGDESMLDVVVREVEMILADRNQKIVAKVLGLRFVRDIMILGHEAIIKRVERLVPHLTKICSHELGSADPDRGDTFFHYHPAYSRLTDQDERREVDTLGSTYLILSLESVLHWAQWVPHDPTGKQSIYMKAYQSLLDRGVKFPTTFHYYKQSDTDKFKNMYKMEFFSDSYDSAYSMTPSEQPSQSDLDPRQSRGSLPAPRSKVKEERPKQPPASQDDYTGEARGLRTVQDMMNYLNGLRVSKARRMGDVRDMHRQVLDMRQNDAHKLSKEDAKWIDGFIVNFSLVQSNLITYDQFLERCVVEEVQLNSSQVEDINLSDRGSVMGSNKSGKPSREPSKLAAPNGRIDQLLREQEIEYKAKINGLLMELQQKNSELAISQSNADKQRVRIIEDYESRIGLIKTEVKKGQQDRGAFQRELQKDNERLRSKAAQLEEQLASFNYNTARERDVQGERNQLLTKVRKLQSENEKLTQLKATRKDVEKQISVLESLVREKDVMLERTKNQLKKAQKQCQNYHDEAGLYKTELLNERNKHEQRLSGVQKTRDSLEVENRGLKEKVLELRKTIDMRDIEVLNMKEELRRFQGKVRDMSEKQQAEQWPRRSNVKTALSPGKESYHEQVPFTSSTKLRFNNYEDLWSQLRPANKELFVRLCRCGLKRKDILFKENELQVGVISEVVSQQKVKFMLHFTNTSEKQLENIRVEHYTPHSYVSTLTYDLDNKYIFCIQPQEQEKITIVTTNHEAPFLKERAILELAYEKHGSSFTTNIFLPLLAPKFFDFYPPKNMTSSSGHRSFALKETVKLKYNKKMLPKPSSLRSYFDGVHENATNNWQMEAFHRQTDLTIGIAFYFAPDSDTLTFEAHTLREKVNERQRYVFEELIGFLEAAFKK